MGREDLELGHTQGREEVSRAISGLMRRASERRSEAAAKGVVLEPGKPGSDEDIQDIADLAVSTGVLLGVERVAIQRTDK